MIIHFTANIRLLLTLSSGPADRISSQITESQTYAKLIVTATQLGQLNNSGAVHTRAVVGYAITSCEDQVGSAS